MRAVKAEKRVEKGAKLKGVNFNEKPQRPKGK